MSEAKTSPTYVNDEKNVLSSTEKTYYLPNDPSHTPIPQAMYQEVMREVWRLRKQYQRCGECGAGPNFVCVAECNGCAYRRYPYGKVSYEEMEDWLLESENADSDAMGWGLPDACGSVSGSAARNLAALEDDSDFLSGMTGKSGCSAESIAVEHIYREELEKEIETMKPQEQVAMRSDVLNGAHASNRDLARMITSETGKPYSHVAAAKCRRSAAEKLARSMGYQIDSARHRIDMQ